MNIERRVRNMKSDILTYLCQSVAKQRTTNLIFVAAIGVCIYEIGKLKHMIKDLKTEGESDTDA